jgi:hypothetical protein
MKFVIFTKTLWFEFPRIRHQVALLLRDYGHEVLFFEKPLPFYKMPSKKKIHEKIFFTRAPELFHHQLRPFELMVNLNASFVKNHLQAILGKSDTDCIVNFNYDYSFLRDIFPSQKIITIINDDFVDLSKPWMKSMVKKQLMKTCEMSDKVFAVSYSLLEEVKKYNASSELFLPWGPDYQAPVLNTDRDVLLYFGYINERVDWSVVRFLAAQGVKLRFVGPVGGRIAAKEIDFLKKNTSFEYLNGRPLAEVPLDDVCCSIAIYNKKSIGVNSITINNRIFQLLSQGIPIIYTDLPNLIDAPEMVIRRFNNYNFLMDSYEFFKENFYDCQEDIQRFLTHHDGENRYQYFLS